MRREPRQKPAVARRVPGAKARRQAGRAASDELPLAHDAATWDEETFESEWDDDGAQIADDIARHADD